MAGAVFQAIMEIRPSLFTFCFQRRELNGAVNGSPNGC